MTPQDTERKVKVVLHPGGLREFVYYSQPKIDRREVDALRHELLSYNMRRYGDSMYLDFSARVLGFLLSRGWKAPSTSRPQ
jgi:hypothetical protein